MDEWVQSTVENILTHKQLGTRRTTHCEVVPRLSWVSSSHVTRCLMHAVIITPILRKPTCLVIPCLQPPFYLVVHLDLRPTEQEDHLWTQWMSPFCPKNFQANISLIQNPALQVVIFHTVVLDHDHLNAQTDPGHSFRTLPRVAAHMDRVLAPPLHCSGGAPNLWNSFLVSSMSNTITNTVFELSNLTYEKWFCKIYLILI